MTLGGLHGSQRANLTGENACACRYIARDNRTHANERAGTDDKRASVGAVANADIGSDVRPVADMDVAVATDARPERDMIADHAIVRDIAVNVALELPANAGGRGHHRMIAKHCTFADFDIGADDSCRSDYGGKPRVEAPGNNPADFATANRNADLIVGSNGIGGYHRDTPNVGMLSIVSEDEIAVMSQGNRSDLTPEPASSVNYQSSHFWNLLLSRPLVQRIEA